MTEREMLLWSILTEPDEDTHRLVFADYLDENGEHERAEYIRLQCGLYGPPLWARQQVFIRCDQLLTKHGRRWADVRGCAFGYVQLADDATSYAPDEIGSARLAEFSRGFVSEIHLPCAAFLKHAASIFAAHPVARVRLTDREPEPWPEYYCWHYTDESHWPRHADELPMCLWRHLDRATARTDDEAHDLLSRAAVTYGRALVGLPPLPTRTAGAV